jgi:teichoic acid transport system permease protein
LSFGIGESPIDFPVVDERGQISAPGALESGAVIVPEAPRAFAEPAAEMAAKYGLRLSGARPTLPQYLVALWQRRHFIVGYATARNVSMYTEAKLGQVWQVLTPLLNSLVYYLIFGLLFEAARGVDHYPAFLVAGVFVFAFSERSIVTGSNVMRANLQLIRALYFPRASLPLAYVIVELQQMLVGMVVLVVIMLFSHQYPSWYWLLLIPAVLLQSMFNTGAALIVARLGGAMQDVSELIPFFLRISRYFCGVMYLIITLPAALTTWEKQILSLNPMAVYIQLVRVAFMSTYRSDSAGNQPYNYGRCQTFILHPGAFIPGTTTPNYAWQAYCHAIVTNSDLWLAAVCWGVGFFVVGLVFFWQAESKYGRG